MRCDSVVWLLNLTRVRHRSFRSFGEDRERGGRGVAQRVKDIAVSLVLIVVEFGFVLGKDNTDNQGGKAQSSRR